MGVQGNYSLYEFRNVQRLRISKQNQIISISSRVIEFWCLVFSAPCSSGGWGMGGWGCGVSGWRVVDGGCPPTHMHAHACMVNMIISCKWPPPLGESMGIPYDVIHTCVCVHAHA